MIKICILANESPNDVYRWVESCKRFGNVIEYRVINLCSYDWFDSIADYNAQIYLCKPGGYSQLFKQLYDERLSILSDVMGYFIYPSLQEVKIYENKKYFSYWLMANGIPHPPTAVFYEKNEAKNWLKQQSYPIVAKTSLGASGVGVEIFGSFHDAMIYVDRAFSSRGIRGRWRPSLMKGRFLHRISRLFSNPDLRKKRITNYLLAYKDTQRYFVIFQKYVPHEYEWRVVRIGDSFFAHKKLKLGEKSSGSLLKNYDTPPLDLLDFVKGITDKHCFYSQAVDIFESKNGYLVNEMQCIFGQSDSYQMLVNGEAGRYVFNESWMFEKGDFNTNESYDLRLEAAIAIHNQINTIDIH